MIIDSNTHIFNESSLKEYNEKLNTDIIISVKFFKGFAGGIFDNRDVNFDRILSLDNSLYVVESIDFEKNVLAQLEILEQKILTNKKIKGIKLYPGYQHFYPNNERLYPIYSFARDHNIPVIFHSGALYHYPNSQAMLKYTHPLHVDEVATIVPNTKFVISHFGFPYIHDTAIVLNKNNNVFSEISGNIDSFECYEAYRYDLVKVLKYYPGIAQQIMFGTDFTGNDTSLNEVNLYMKLVEEVFDSKTRDYVFYKNAQLVFGL